MKKLIPFSLFFIVTLNCIARSVQLPPEIEPAIHLNDASEIDIETFLALTPKKIRQQTGRKLTIKQALALKAAQKKIKKELHATDPFSTDKSQVTALLLVIFVGIIGIHRFYLGYPGMGVLMLISAGGCGVLVLVDLILIATGELQPRWSSYVDSLD